jgi:[citrate (pro-3S)-lyase] ligase
MEIRSLSLTRERAAIDAFYERAGIRLDAAVDTLFGVFDGETLLALGGTAGNAIRSLAVDCSVRSEGLLPMLATHLYKKLKSEGSDNVFVVTKPEYAPLFSSLCFYERVRTSEAALLESRRDGLERFLSALPQADGAIVMNADPFTYGHRYLAETAAKRCGRLLVLVLSKDAAHVPAEARLDLVRKGCADLAAVSVFPGGDYVISSATFPDYFFKDKTEAALAGARLDATLFAEQIAPRCGIKTRFVGEEPLDPMTAGYNDALRTVLQSRGISVRIIPRKTLTGRPISASRVRALWQARDYAGIEPMVPKTTLDYIRRNAL